MVTHFKSLLNYLKDQKAFMKIFDGLEPSYLQVALDYIDENGVMSYGCVVEGKRDDIISLSEDTLVKAIYISEVDFAY